jgi:hypothetical protein
MQGIIYVAIQNPVIHHSNNVIVACCAFDVVKCNIVHLKSLDFQKRKILSTLVETLCDQELLLFLELGFS